MNIKYIYHSGFSLELERNILVFDYYKGNIPEFSQDKNIYIFSSHSHYDHFSDKIFTLRSNYKNIEYILSNDIKTEAKDDILLLGPDETTYLNDLKITTLKSSDLGVAFIVEVEGKVIYHAGDLNWWHWEGESLSENQNAENLFKTEINKIKDRYFDMAFLPLDPRQGSYYYLGFDYFMKNTKTKKAFPMHCCDDYSVIDKLMNSESSKGYRNSIMKISNIHNEFSI